MALLSTSGPEALRASPCSLLVLPARAEVKEPCRPALVVALVAACVTVIKFRCQWNGALHQTNQLACLSLMNCTQYRLLEGQDKQVAGHVDRPTPSARRGVSCERHALVSVPRLPSPAAAAVLLLSIWVSRPKGGFFFFPLAPLPVTAFTSILPEPTPY